MVSLAVTSSAAAEAAVPRKSALDQAISRDCVTCRASVTPWMHNEREKSRRSGASVDSLRLPPCDGRCAGGAHAHAYDGKPVFISTRVTPARCAACHPKEVAQQPRSHHSGGEQILASLDNILGKVIGGPAAVNAAGKPTPQAGARYRYRPHHLDSSPPFP